VFLEVRASNEAAQHLYAALGFTRVGERRRYYRFPTEDAVILRTGIPASSR
jgi:ribosomal-protein-alanine N-acetyltransferase